MAQRLNNKYTFYHIPRCGGTFIRHTLTALKNVETTEIGKPFKILPGHASPIDVTDHSFENSFCVIRHPLSFYESFYRYKAHTTFWATGYQQASNFDEFVRQVLRIRPAGFATEWYLRFVPFCKHVLKLENIAVELKQLLNSWGFECELHKEYANASPKISTKLKKETREMLFGTERNLMKYTGYE
jgi:hypothetical protein